jgi:penicillin amidase
MITSLVAAAALLAAPQDGGAPFTDSLARAAGEVTVAGLSAPVTVERDALGIPVIRGAALEDVVRAQGFVHAQERYFQMDMTRRFAAGRLAEVGGPMLVSMDRRNRPLRLEQVAARVLEGLPARHRRLIDVYTAGVNAGLADLDAPPPEYVIMRASPEPWSSTDGILVLYAMFEALNFNAAMERRRAVMAETLPDGLHRFLTPESTRWDTPLVGGSDRYEPMPVPGPDVVDLRTASLPAAPLTGLVDVPPLVAGSNNWAVAGDRTAHGGAIVANDPHLQITAPGIWFRCEMAWEGGRARGASLPGNPGVVIGATDALAWGFTNTMGDFQDLIVVETSAGDPGTYRTPDGPEPFEEIVETIEVRGGAPIDLPLRVTRWGVVTETDAAGRPLVLDWTALHAEMVNTGLMDIMHAATLEEGVEIVRTWYGPSQNAVIADDRGRIAWVVSGYLPRRTGFDGTVPTSRAEAGVGWDGPQDERHRPMLVDPPEGILFTANNRTVDVAWARRLGGTWALGARAQRIAERLRAAETLSEDDLLGIQLDTRVEVFDFYRDLVMEASKGAVFEPPVAEARRVVAGWNGTADADQAGLRILHAYRRALHDAIITPLVAPCRARDARFGYHWFGSEETVRRVLEERPAHLLPPGADDWPAFLRTTLRRVALDLRERAPDDGLTAPWGVDNTAMIQHPLASAAPAFAGMLSMPKDHLSGHSYAVRVALPAYGASLRMVASPGRLERGRFQIPAGQSGHPMSPHYRDSHAAWVDGRPTPFLAGPVVSKLVLTP